MDYERGTLFRFLDFMTGAFFLLPCEFPFSGKRSLGTKRNTRKGIVFICARHDRAICCERPQTASSEEGLGLAQLDGITGWIKVEKLGNEVVIVVGINSK